MPRSRFRLLWPSLRQADVGCIGGALLVLLTAIVALGLVAMVWWHVREFL